MKTKSLSDKKEGTRVDHRLVHNGETKRDTLARGITTLKEGTVPSHLLPYPGRTKEL